MKVRDSEEEGSPAGGCFVKRVSQQPHKKHLLHAARKGEEQKLNVAVSTCRCLHAKKQRRKQSRVSGSLSLPLV